MESKGKFNDPQKDEILTSISGGEPFVIYKNTPALGFNL
jgi:hypothetical protein